MNRRGAFDPTDDFDALAEAFKQRVCDLVIEALSVPAFRALGPQRQIECVMAGITTGLVGVCFSMITPPGRDEMMEAIAAYLPQARENAESIIQSGRA